MGKVNSFVTGAFLGFFLCLGIWQFAERMKWLPPICVVEDDAYNMLKR